jgi:hypothetical protein
MTTKTKTTPQVQIQNTTPTQIQAQNTTQTQNSPVQNTTTQTPTRRVISITPRDGARGRPGRPASKPSKDYIVDKLRELLLNSEIDLGDYISVKLLQIYITSFTANYVQGLLLTLARHKDDSALGLIANLAFRINMTTGDLKVSVKNAVRVYSPLLDNLVKLTENLDVTYVFK